MTRLMTTMGGGVVVDSYHKHFPSDGTNYVSSENWDDDFEFQAQGNSCVIETPPELAHASGSKHHFEEGEESWDDAYADDDGPSSPPRRAPKNADDEEEVEDWDFSDNEPEDPRSSIAREFGDGTYEEEDKTVTARSTASGKFGNRPPSPPPPIPPLPPISVPNDSTMQDTVFPLLMASPTLSTFSIPVSSNRDHSVYSNEGLIRTSSGSAPHLTIMRSYPHGAGSTPPRKGRRLRKKSRPPEVDIIELEDCNEDHLTPFPHTSTPPENLDSSSQLPSPTTASTSLLNRIGSFKRWTRRSIGPEEVSFAGWRRTKSSFGPSDIPASESSSKEISPTVYNDGSNTSPPLPKGRNRGSSASGLKSGWFFRSGGTGDVETTSVPPKPSSIVDRPSSPTEAQQFHMPPKPNVDVLSLEPSPKLDLKRSKSRLAPILKSPIKNKPDVYKESQPRESNGVSGMQPGPGLGNNLSRHSEHQFPRYSASVGRHAGSSLFTELVDNKNAGKDKDGGVKGLVKGMRRLSQVGIYSHKRTKSTGKPTNNDLGSSLEVDQQVSISTTLSLLPPVELNSPISPSAIFSRRGSLPQADFAFVLSANGSDKPAYVLSPVLPPESGMSMERMSFSSSRAPSQFNMVDRPKPNRRATSPMSAAPPSPTESSFRPDSAMSTKRPGSATSTRRPGSSSSSCPPVSAQAQALAVQSFRPRTPVRNSPSVVGSIVSTGRPRTPNKLQAGSGHSPQTSTAPSAYTASLGRTSTPPQLPKSSLKRSSLSDLRSTPSKPPSAVAGPTSPLPSDDHSNGQIKEHRSLDHRRASTNTLSELKIPTRISKVQQGLRRDLGMLREFAGYVEELRRLQKSYMKLVGELCIIYDSPALPSVPSRPPSQLGFSRRGFTWNSNASTQSIQRPPSQQQTSMLLNSPTKTRNHYTSRSANELSRQLSRLEQEYGLWWECAELLVELGGGSSSMAAASSSNLNLTSHSSSSALSTDTCYDAGPPLVPKPYPKLGSSHVSSMSDPGSIAQNQSSIQIGSNKTSLEASPPQSQWRSSTGRHDLSSRQLRLLRDMLNTPDPSALPDNPAYLTTKSEAWNGRNPSAITLPSDESFMDQNSSELSMEKNKERKRRLGIIDFLRNIRKAAVAEGRLAPRSESSMSSHTDAEDDDHYNRRRSPWHQHQHDTRHIHHEQPLLRMPTSKSPGRPSLASIFRIGGKDKSWKGSSSRDEDSVTTKAQRQASRGTRKVSAESSGVGDADDEHGERDQDEWEKMSQSELDLVNTNFTNGTGTIRGRKSNKKQSLPSMHPYSDQGATTPKKTLGASRTSLLLGSAMPSILSFTPSGNHVMVSKSSKHKLRTSSWSQSQTHVLQSSVSVVAAGKAPVSGTVRSAPPADVNSSSVLDPKVSLSPENIKPLLEYAKEVSTRLEECVSEVQVLLRQRI